MPTNYSELAWRLCEEADRCHARPTDFAFPLLGLVFLRYADLKFSQAEKRRTQQSTGGGKICAHDYLGRGILFVPENARFSYLLKLPDVTNIGKALNDAMEGIETKNAYARLILPKTYNYLENRLLFSLLEILSSVPSDVDGDFFGKVYEELFRRFGKLAGLKDDGGLRRKWLSV